MLAKKHGITAKVMFADFNADFADPLKQYSNVIGPYVGEKSLNYVSESISKTCYLLGLTIVSIWCS